MVEILNDCYMSKYQPVFSKSEPDLKGLETYLSFTIYISIHLFIISFLKQCDTME